MNTRATRFFRHFFWPAVAAVLIATGFPGNALRADTTLNSGTTTISTGTDFGTNLYVGHSGTAKLEVVAGGSATATTAYLGYAAAGNGTVTVSGGTWASSSRLEVGVSGVGTLNVSGGSVISNGNVWLGNYDGSVGTAVITGGTWATGVLTVGQVTALPGHTGIGTLTRSGGLVTVANSLNRGATGTINLNAGGRLQIGTGGRMAGSPPILPTAGR